MGYSIAWLAVQGAAVDELHSRLAVRPTGEDDEYFESPIAGGALRGGWYLVIGNRCDHRIVTESLLGDLSQSHEVVACSVEEHVMYSSATAWSRGERVWSIVHDSSRGILDLQATGAPPEAFEKHKARCLAEQKERGGSDANVDYVFDVPLDVARDLTGFKHSERIDCLAQECLEALADAQPRPWWKLW